MMEDMKGAAIIRVNVALTLLFTLSAVVAAVVFDKPWTTIAVGVCLLCFTVGIVTFLWGYWTAVQRSREDEISVAALYFLVDGVAPKSVGKILNGLFGAQVIVGIATALARTTTNGKAGSTLAFGILVPMLGIGINGLWGATYGSFRPRNVNGNEAMPQESPETRQDEDHD